VIEFEAVKLVLQLVHFSVVCSHLGAVVARLLHDLVDDELRVAPNVQPSDPQLNGDVQAIKECSILGHIVRGREMKVNHVPHAHSERETKTSPMSAPFFINDPSKYIVQYS
jgi:hypothetical protein